MNKLLLFCMLVVFCVCPQTKAQQTRDINDIIHIIKNRAQYPNYVLVAAHRGYWMDYPENSIPAYNAAINLGADIVEMDVRITFDEEMVIFHDACLDRVTTGYGTLRTLPFNEVKDLKLKNIDGTVTSEKLLKLSDALDALKGKAVASIDIKETGEYFNKVLLKVISLAQQKDMLNQLLIKGKLRLADLNAVLQQAGVTLDDIIYTPIAFDNTRDLDAYINEYINSGKIYAFELVYKRSASPILKYVSQLQQKTYG
ncbi:MAG: glycerophosphodiester phosphodiesterase family protein [Bacteroides sp.]|nr:glycerophosphodiester phosphodiesterase family protein [Bacteroides sp.]